MKTNLSIYVEYDYSKFKFMPWNRSIKGNNKKLINSISEHDITPYTPILVDKNMQILDGQHRFDACRKLGKPIYYIVYDGDEPPEDVMVCLNTCIKPWRQEEWIQFYYNKGYPVYVKFVEMAKKYDLTISNNILLFSGSKGNSSDVKKGKKLSDETKRKIGEASRGRIISEETKRKIGNKNRGKKHSKEHTAKWIKSNMWRFHKIEIKKNEILVGVYESIREAARRTGLSRGFINGTLRNPNGKHQGYTIIILD